MKRQTTVRLGAVLFMLALVLSLSFGVQEVQAAPCCESCEESENQCIANTSSGPCYGEPQCCFDQLWTWCWRICRYCW